MVCLSYSIAADYPHDEEQAQVSALLNSSQNVTVPGLICASVLQEGWSGEMWKQSASFLHNFVSAVWIVPVLELLGQKWEGLALGGGQTQQEHGSHTAWQPAQLDW